jgi:GT2 family glycosyltransferase
MHKKNYLHYIQQSRITKRSNILINIPTYQSYLVTKKSIKYLLKQTNIQFDILIIDNGSNDCQRLKKDFPFINYIVLKKNTGSSGAQRIGMELAIKYKYEFVVCVDNDARLLDNDALSKLYTKIINDNSIGCVSPNHCDNRITRDEIRKKQLPFHFLFIRTSVLKKIELHNFYHFLVTDDIAFVSKLISKSKVLLCHDIKYHHEHFKSKFLQNQTLYLGIRGFLIILFFEKDISLWLRFYHLLHFFYFPVVCMIHAAQTKDLSYIKTMYFALRDFIRDYKIIHLDQLPRNKYVLVPSPKPIPGAVKMNLLNSLFLRRAYYIYSYYHQKKIFYILKALQ